MSEYEDIRRLVIPRRLLEHYGIQFQPKQTKEGMVLEAKCPFCEKNAAFKMYENAGFQCFACKEAERETRNGGCFDFVMHMEKVGLPKAKELLRQMFSAAPPVPTKPMERVDAWLDELVVLEDGETTDAWKVRVKNQIKSRLMEWYKAGQKNKGPSSS